MTIESDDAAWTDPDRAVQIEDDNPEALAGEEVDFDSDEPADDEAADDEADDNDGEA